MNAVAVMSAPTMPASGSSVRSAEVPVAHHSPASEPIHCSQVPSATPITPVTTNARTARHVPIRRSATPSRRIDARTPNTSWNGSYGMNRAVTTVHHWPSSNVVMTPAAQVCSVASGAVPIAVPVDDRRDDEHDGEGDAERHATDESSEGLAGRAQAPLRLDVRALAMGCDVGCGLAHARLP